MITDRRYLIILRFTCFVLWFAGFKERSFFNLDNPAVILETVKKVRKLCRIL